MPHLAFYTFGVLREPPGHPSVQGFFDRVEAVFARAEESVGFVGRDDGSWGPPAAPAFFDREAHAPAQVTLSLWTDLESVCAFAYRGPHMEAFKKRHEWGIEGEWPTYVAWWVADDHVPTPAEACERLERLHESGPGPLAFDFKHPFDADGRPRELDRPLFRKRVQENTGKQVGRADSPGARG